MVPEVLSPIHPSRGWLHTGGKQKPSCLRQGTDAPLPKRGTREQHRHVQKLQWLFQLQFPGSPSWEQSMTDSGPESQQQKPGKFREKTSEIISPRDRHQKPPSRECLEPNLILVPSKCSHCLLCWIRLCTPGHNWVLVSSTSSPGLSWLQLMCSLQLCHPAGWNSKLSEVLELAFEMSENRTRNYSRCLFATFLVCLSGLTLTAILNLFIYFAIYLFEVLLQPFEVIHMLSLYIRQHTKTLSQGSWLYKKHQKLVFSQWINRISKQTGIYGRKVRTP